MSFIWKLLWLVFFAVGCFWPLQSFRADRLERTRAAALSSVVRPAQTADVPAAWGITYGRL